MSSNPTSLVYPGYILSSITVLGRARFLESTLTTAALLSAIAGPGAGVEGPGGELIDSSLNLITTGRDSISSRRLRELLIEPITSCQRLFREIGHSLSPTRLDDFAFNGFEDDTKAVLERNRNSLNSSIPPSPSAHKQEAGVLRRPTFVLQSPDLETLRRAIPETMDGSPLIISDTVVDELLAGSKNDSKSFAVELAGLIAGQDRPIEGVDKRVGPGRIEALRAHLFASSTKDALREAWMSQNMSIQQILQRCLLLDPTVLPPGKAQMEPENVRSGYRWYYTCVRKVLDARRLSGGLQWRLTPAASKELHEFTGELQDWASSLPDRMKPFFSDILSLPYRLYWTCATTEVGNDHDWVLPFTLQTTREFIEHQKIVLGEFMESSEAHEHRKARITMLRKLSERPCIFRDLLRRYSIQRRDVHEPVLSELVNEGLIRLRNDGLMELSEIGRKELAA